MEKNNFNLLLLKTAFSCMACDGHIDDREIKLIQTLSEEKKLFGNLDSKLEMQSLIADINEHGHAFLRTYLLDLEQTSLSEEEELKLITVSIDVIKADDELEYSEIKFFKMIRSKLSIKDEKILDSFPEYEEYLEEDVISDTYLTTLQTDFFENFKTPQFELLPNIEDDLIE